MNWRLKYIRHAWMQSIFKGSRSTRFYFFLIHTSLLLELILEKHWIQSLFLKFQQWIKDGISVLGLLSIILNKITMVVLWNPSPLGCWHFLVALIVVFHFWEYTKWQMRQKLIGHGHTPLWIYSALMSVSQQCLQITKRINIILCY